MNQKYFSKSDLSFVQKIKSAYIFGIYGKSWFWKFEPAYIFGIYGKSTFFLYVRSLWHLFYKTIVKMDPQTPLDPKPDVFQVHLQVLSICNCLGPMNMQLRCCLVPGNTSVNQRITRNVNLSVSTANLVSACIEIVASDKNRRLLIIRPENANFKNAGSLASA